RRSRACHCSRRQSRKAWRFGCPCELGLMITTSVSGADAYLDRIHLRVQRGNRRPCDALLPSPPFWWGATPSEATNGPPSVSLAVRHAFGRSQFGIPHPVRPATMIRYLFLVLTLLPLSAMQRSPVVSSSDEPARFEKIGDG